MLDTYVSNFIKDSTLTDVSASFSDHFFLSRALQISISSTVNTSPNPSVGAVIVANNRILGEGFTQEDGGPHAEVMAFRAVSDRDRHLLPQATIYTSLEPCSIFGRTPPCCDLIIKHQLKRVVVGCIDFTPGVLGNGLRRIREAGIEVSIGILQDLSLELSKFRQAITRFKRPYVILKQAVSLDGFVGVTDHQLPLTARMANTLSHQWRSQMDAILVGANTASIDNPSLSTRLVAGRTPARIILDPKGRVSLTKHVFAQAKMHELPTYWAVDSAYAKTCTEKLNHAQLAQVIILELNEEHRIQSLLDQLLVARVGRLLVEGGPSTLAHFVNANAYDEYREWKAPISAGHHSGAIPAAVVPGKRMHSYLIGPDTLTVKKNLAVNC